MPKWPRRRCGAWVDAMGSTPRIGTYRWWMMQSVPRRWCSLKMQRFVEAICSYLRAKWFLIGWLNKLCFDWLIGTDLWLKVKRIESRSPSRFNTVSAAFVMAMIALVFVLYRWCWGGTGSKVVSTEYAPLLRSELWLYLLISIFCTFLVFLCIIFETECAATLNTFRELPRWVCIRFRSLFCFLHFGFVWFGVNALN